MTTTRCFTLKDAKSDKFWNITLAGASHTVHYGRAGTSGQQRTKAFESESKARASFDKLIAEKVRKGYVEGAGSPGAAPASTPPKSSRASTAQAEPARATRAAAAPPPETGAPAPIDTSAATSAAPQREIRIEPEEWHIATWRALDPVTAEPRPFDPDACVKRAKRIRYSIDWHRAGIPYPMTRSEAVFWMRAICERGETPLEEIVAGLEAGDDVDEALMRAELCEPEAYWNDELVPVFATLLGARQLVELVLTEPAAEFRGWDTRAWRLVSTEVLPFVSAEDRAALRAAAADALRDAAWDTSSAYPSTPFRLHAAATLGAHAELQAFVDSWADDEFGEYADHYQAPQTMILGLGSAEATVAAARRCKIRFNTPPMIRGWLATTECTALDVVRESILEVTNKDAAIKAARTLALAIAPETAPEMLALLGGSRASGVARDWLYAHHDQAIAGLVPVAAKPGKPGDAAIKLLRAFRRDGHEALIRAAGGADVARVADEVLTTAKSTHPVLDPASAPAALRDAFAAADDVPVRGKDPLGWVHRDELPPLLVAGGHALGESEIERTLRALWASPLDAPHALVTALREHAEPASRDAFAWQLFELWLEAGADTKSKWALLAVGHLGGDRCALGLTPMVRAWPGQSQHQRAVLGLQCLRAIGSETALMQLNGIAQKLKFRALKDRARVLMGEIAADRGLTRDELEDLIVPDCGLDEHGRRAFDFGPRQFEFVLGPELKPMVRDANGKVRANPPKPGKSDDAELAARALEDWKTLKKQIRETGKIQAQRLEQAMITGRRWPAAAFERHLVRHPLMTHLSRQLVFAVYDGTAVAATFRVTEEQDYADREDAPFALPGDASVGIVHPAHLDDAARRGWGELLTDYEIVPPFEQLGRTVLALEPGERSGTDIVRFAGRKVPAISMVGILDRQGWSRGIPQDAGFFFEHSKPFFAADVTAVVQYPGVSVGYIGEGDDQDIERCFFVPGIYTPEIYHEHERRVPLADVDEVVISEVLRDLGAIAARAT